jgi:F-type H+-transporting ATPase subunit delta
LGASSTSSSSEAAQRYSAALFDLAVDAGDLDGIEAGLSSLAEAISANKELNKTLSAPIHSIDDKKAVLAKLGEKAGLSELAMNFIGVVLQNGRAGDLVGIAKAFANKAAAHRGMTRVVARSAKKLTAAQAKKLTSTVSAALGRDVDIEEEVDPALIGGLQLRVGSRLIDASLRTKLDDLTNAMKGA